MTKETLRISNNVSLPLDAVTETFAIMAMRGVGKTHTASVMAEEMLKAGQPIVVYDPTGAWWGLKTSADGKHPGFQVVIFGGEHADVPLEEGAGEIVARAIVENRISAILDCSLLRKAPRLRFMTAFSEELYRLNREPMHLFLDEAHTVAPQNLRAIPEAAKLVGALEDIVTQGRRRGLGLTTITQRPALLNSTLRNVCGTLIVMRVQGPHDRKAIQEWIEEAQANPEQAKMVLPSLATLPRGEGWIWSPAWLGILERVRFRQRETFDSSATPEVGKKAVQPSAFAEVDIEKLGAAIAATVERAKADDPKTLRAELGTARKRIAELERSTGSGAEQQQQVESLALKLRSLEDSWRGLAKTCDARGRALFDAADKLTELATDLRLRTGSEKFADSLPEPAIVNTPPPVRQQPTVRLQKKETPVPSEDLTGPEQRILNAIAWMESIGVSQPEQPAVAFLAGYTYGGGAFNNPRGRLNVKGLVEYIPGERIQLTEAGRDLAEFPERIATNEELHRSVLERLPGPEQRLLGPLLEAYPKAMTNESLARAAGYTPGAGAFNNPRGRLRSLGLIDYPQPGMVRARDLLFPR